MGKGPGASMNRATSMSVTTAQRTLWHHYSLFWEGIFILAWFSSYRSSTKTVQRLHSGSTQEWLPIVTQCLGQNISHRMSQSHEIKSTFLSHEILHIAPLLFEDNSVDVAFATTNLLVLVRVIQKPERLRGLSERSLMAGKADEWSKRNKKSRRVAQPWIVQSLFY